MIPHRIAASLHSESMWSEKSSSGAACMASLESNQRDSSRSIPTVCRHSSLTYKGSLRANYGSLRVTSPSRAAILAAQRGCRGIPGTLVLSVSL